MGIVFFEGFCSLQPIQLWIIKIKPFKEVNNKPHTKNTVNKKGITGQQVG